METAAATAMEAASTAPMETASAAAVEAAAHRAAPSVSAAIATAASITAAIAAAISYATTIAVAAVTVAASVAIAAAIPRAGTDEETAVEPLRTVVAIRGASIRRVAVVTIGANRSGIAVRTANTDADGDLRVRFSRWRKGETKTYGKKCKIPKKTHDRTPSGSFAES
jgi:hypothetical protein